MVPIRRISSRGLRLPVTLAQGLLDEVECCRSPIIRIGGSGSGATKCRGGRIVHLNQVSSAWLEEAKQQYLPMMNRKNYRKASICRRGEIIQDCRDLRKWFIDAPGRCNMAAGMRQRRNFQKFEISKVTLLMHK